MIVYGIIAAIGFLFLLLMLFLGEMFGADHEVGAHDISGGHLEADHGGGPSIFSARIMASFVTSFGVGGVVGRYYHLTHPASSGIGILSGVVLSSIVYQFARFLYSQQASSEVRMSSLVGRFGEVSISIPAGGIGQVALTVGGERSEHMARTADGSPLSRGAEVVIIGLRGDGVVVAAPDPAPRGGSR
jgi:membrane protein implicated in regulation of membrane protease activity